MKKRPLRRGLIGCLLGLAVVAASCTNDDIPSESYYTFTGQTLGQYLQNNADDYSDFVNLLNRSYVTTDGTGSTVLEMLNSYGYYTCFAPDNETMAKYLAKEGLASIEEVSDSAARVLSLMSIISSSTTVYETQYFENRLPDQNLYKKTIYVTSSGGSTYCINDMATITEQDIEVHNGVIQRVDSVLEPSDLTLLGFFEEHPEYSLFLEALELTAVYERVNSEQEDIYYTAPASMEDNDGNTMQNFPTQRFYGFTCFVEPNTVYEAAGITDIEGLKTHAKNWFKETYETDAPEIYALGNNENYTDSDNYLNRFVAYHFVNKSISQADFDEASSTFQSGYEKYLDYAETLAPGQILCLAAGKNTFSSDDYDGRLQLNPSPNQVALENISSYRTWTRPTSNGVLLADKTQMISSIGYFHELESILTFPRSDFQKTRLRLDMASLFPEMMSNSIRYVTKEGAGYGLPEGFLSNYWLNSTSTVLYYLQSSSPATTEWNDFQGDEFIAKGNFDFTVRLPPVPAGLYEVRLGYTVNTSRGCGQMYLGTSLDNLTAAGIPVDLTVRAATKGWVEDANDDTDYESDKLLRANGYMKGPNSSNAGGGQNTTVNLRQVGGSSYSEDALRVILGTIQLTTDGSIYVRFRNATTSTTPQFMMDYIEVCPSNIYDNPDTTEPRD